MRLIRAVIIFMLVLAADVSFTPQTAHLFNPQQVTRLALSLSLLDGHTQIDGFAGHTVDIASYDGHAYADKPPGLSMLALPAVAVVKAGMGSPDPMQPEAMARYLGAAIVSTNGLLGALAAALLYLVALRLAASERSALLASAVLALGTPFFGWSTLFFAHAASGSLQLCAFAVAVMTVGRWRELLVGLLLGLLLTVDLTAAPAAILVAGYAALTGSAHASWRTGMLALGGVVGLLPLLAYGEIAFGSPFHLGYSDVVGFEGMKQGLFGLTAPDPGALLQILFGLYRGLLPLSPVLLMVPVGVLSMWRAHRREALVVIGTIIAALAINSSYAYWDGGSTTGPRHLVSMLPMACLSLAFVRARGVAAGGVAVLAAGSFAISVICASTEMLSGVEHAAPFFDDILPRFIANGPLGAAPVVVSWLGFALLGLWRPRLGAQRDQLAARPLDPSREIQLEQQ